MSLAQRDFSVSLATLLIVSLLAWATGITFIRSADAAVLTSVSDTLSDSDLSVASDHTIKFTTPTGVSAAETIVYTFPTAATEFSSSSIAALVLADIDFEIAGVDQTVTSTASCAGAGFVGFSIATSTATSTISIEICTSNLIAANASTTLEVGINAGGSNQITNPSAASSYIINILGTQTDSADLRVAIIDDVVVTASVDVTFTFAISGVSSGATTANGEGGTTDVATTATTIPWGTLSPGTAKVARQDLAVTTNATNGFVVTIEQDQNLLSSTGADIDLFADGNGTSSPSVWASPAGTLDSENTYGHYGFTSADDLNSDEFGTALYVGNVTSSRQIFSHTGPADGSTANKGATEIGFKIEINALQEAGKDYTNSLTYIATPTF